MSNNKKENLMALKEMLKNTIREDAQVVYEFEKNVNEAAHKAGGRKRMIATGDYVANMVMGDMCDRIINSKMPMADKECVLSNISYLLDVAKTGAVLNAMSAEERQKAVEEAAEEYIKTHKDIAEKMHPTGGTTETHKTEVVEYMEENNEILNDARFIVNTYIDNFQTVVYDDYNYPYPHYGITADQYDEMVAEMKKDFEEILNNFKEVVEVFLNTYKEYEDIIDYPNEKNKAYDIVEDIDLAISNLLAFHNGKKDSSVLRYLIETYVRCNLYIDKLHN